MDRIRFTKAPPGLTPDEAARRARERGVTAYVIDGPAGREAALDAIAAALRFPAYFGRNLDALYDCLTDLSWLPEGRHLLVWSRPSALRAADPAGYEAIEATLADATDANPALSVTLLAD